MKLNLKTLKPRNPFVVAGLRRAAGSHRAGKARGRQDAALALRQEIDRLRQRP